MSPGLTDDGDHHCRRRRPYDSAVIALDAMRNAVYLYAEARAMLDRDHVEPLPENCEPALERPNRFHTGIDARTVHLNAILPQAHAVDLHGVSILKTPQLDHAAYFVANLRPAAQRRSVEPRLFDAELSLVSLDGGLDECNVQMPARNVLAFGGKTIHPANVDFTALHFLAA